MNDKHVHRCHALNYSGWQYGRYGFLPAQQQSVFESTDEWSQLNFLPISTRAKKQPTTKFDCLCFDSDEEGVAELFLIYSYYIE